MQYMEATREKEEARAAKNSVMQKRAVFIVMAVLLTAVMASFPVMAASGNGSASSMMTKLISLMCSMFKYVGTALFVWAIIQFILATKRSDADSKADAIQTAVCGIALIGIATVVNSLGIGVSGVTDTELK